MADLSARLPTEVDSQKRFIASAPATSSFLTSLADFGSAMVGVADRAVTSIERNKGNKDALDERAAHNDAAKGFAAIFGDPSAKPTSIADTVTNDPAHNAAVAASKGAAGQVVNQQTAAAQGTIDPAMAQVRSLAVLRQVMAAHPGHEAAVVSTFKELGVTNMITQQYANAENLIEADQTAQHATISKLEDSAVNKWGYANYFQMNPEDKAKTLATVGQLEAQEADLDAKSKLAELSLKNVQLTDSQRKQVQTQASSGLSQTFTNYMTTNFGNLSKVMINMLGDPALATQPGRLEELQSHLLNVAIPSLDTSYNLKLAPLLGTLTPEDRQMIDGLYQSQRKSLVDMISGPQSVVESNKRILESLSNTMGIDYAKSAPTLLRLQKMIGPQAVGVLLSPQVLGNKPLMKMLGDELNGVMRDPSRMPSFTEFVQSLNGTIDPNSWDPEKIRAAAPASLSATNALAHDSASSNGTDKQGHQALVNSIKQTASLAVDVVPQWGFNNILMQGKALNVRGVTTALFNTKANVSEQQEAIRAWLPANTRTYQTLSVTNSGDSFYTAKLDPHTLMWSAAWNGKAETRAMPGVGTDVQLNAHPSPSTKVLEQVSTLNHMLNNLSDAASKGYDESLGGKSIPYQEARRYFATGQEPKSLQSPAGKSGKTPEQNVDDAISHMLDFVNKLPTPADTANIPTGPLTETIKTSAASHGVPVEIAQRLFHMETGSGRNKARSDKGAVGPGQIMPATAAAYGKDVNKLTDLENVDLSLQILADNYRKTGSWEDAVAMYHSGVNLATAAKQNRTDGHMRTTDYVASIVGPSSISVENLARYGYVRR